jgi:large subunit ribosomal protein L13
MKSFIAKTGEVPKKWVLIDLKGKVLGRAASQIADILRGKTKPTYTPHNDSGDFVVVINASQVKLTGNKLVDKKYHFHSTYIGGMKEISAGHLLERSPERLITLAVKGMLPHTALGKKVLKKLKVYAGGVHPHVAQQPQTVELKG